MVKQGFVIFLITPSICLHALSDYTEMSVLPRHSIRYYLHVLSDTEEALSFPSTAYMFSILLWEVTFCEKLSRGPQLLDARWSESGVVGDGGKLLSSPVNYPLHHILCGKKHFHSSYDGWEA